MKVLLFHSLCRPSVSPALNVPRCPSAITTLQRFLRTGKRTHIGRGGAADSEGYQPRKLTAKHHRRKAGPKSPGKPIRSRGSRDFTWFR